MKLPVAYQVYSAREEAAADFKGTMAAIKEYGYDGVELAGLYGLQPEAVQDILRELGLTALSAHVPLAELDADLEGTLRRYQTIGCSFIAIPYLPTELQPVKGDFELALRKIKTIGEACVRHNVTLLYHNHDFEFARLPDGSYALDSLYRRIPESLLQTELDTCWIKVSGEDPVAYLKTYAGRCPLVHLKDFVGRKSEHMYGLIGEEEQAAASERFAFRPLGEGVQDFPSILSAAGQAGARWLVVEQDAHGEHTPLEDAKISIDYLRGKME